ncbi:hypothetical protein [uncultured Mobiluncus sp.]|uniref:hypothetical protein n=1 Tax=uncultured Mobiluncus sp. TaxID=293425 RepID=UPI002805157D|nr:hypothetical protein [uncultured Mobiluncus sp.]
MTSEQYPGLSPNGGPNGVPPQTPNGAPPQASGPVPSAYSNQPAAPQNQPAAPNGSAYQAPPGYAVANGQPAAAPVTKSRQGLVIGIVATSLVLVLAITLFILLFSGARFLPGGSKASGEADKSVVTGLTQSEKELELIDMGNDPGKDYAFAGDTLLSTDGDEVWAFSLKSQQEIWRSSDVIEELNCDPAYGPWFVDRAESNPNLALLNCPSETTTRYAVISAKDGKIVTSKELNVDDMSAFMEILKDGSLVTCENNELTRYDRAIGIENKLWSQPVEECGYGVREYDSGWLRMTWEGEDWGQLFNLQDGSQPIVAQTFIDSIKDLEEDSYSFTPLAKGNFAVEYYTKTGEDTSVGHAVIVDAQGQPLSQTYDNAFFSIADDERVVLAISYEFTDDYKLKKSTRLDPATGQELWTNADAGIGCAFGADKQFIWGRNSLCGSGGAPAEHSGLVLDTNTGKTLPMGGLRDAQDIYRTDSGFIVETYDDEEENGGIKLKSFAWKDGEFVKLWSRKFKDIPYLVEHQHRLYAISPGDDNGIVGYLGYK